jgi:hypothetical protein
MMPEAMKTLLCDSLPAPARERSLSEEGGKRYLELRRDDEPALRVAGISVAEWLRGHAVAFRDLSAQRAEAGEKWRREAISRNVREEVDLLASEPDGARIGHGLDACTILFPVSHADIVRGSSCEPKRPQR